MAYFAVIDTETNQQDQVMSIGSVIADAETFCPVDAKYHETHNAIYDAMDELTIMRLLGRKIEDYIPL